MQDNNPFNTAVLNEVRPTYIGPPLETLSAAREHLSQTIKDNNTAKGLLDQAFANTIAEVNEDPEAVRMIIEHKNNFERDLGAILSEKNMAYAGNTIQNYVNKFTGDPRIAGRRRNVAEYKGYIDAIRNNKNIPNSTIKAFIENIKYPNLAEVDDDNFLYRLKEFTMPYERVDINKELLEAAKVKLQYPDMTSWADLELVNSRGEVVTDILDGDIAFIRKANGTTKFVRPGELKAIFDSVLRNNDAARGYLLQESVVGDYYRDKSLNPVERLDEIYNNPELMNIVIDNAINSLAGSLHYTQSVKDADLRQINTRMSDRTTNTGTPYPSVQKYVPGGEMYTKNKTSEEIETSLKNTEEQLENIFIDSKQPVADVDNKAFVAAVRNNDSEIAFGIGERYGIEPTKLQEYVTKTREILLERDLAEKKREKTLANVRYTPDGVDLYPELESMLHTPEFDEIRNAGFDYNDYDGITTSHKIKNMFDYIKKMHYAYTAPYTQLREDNVEEASRLIKANAAVSKLSSEFNESHKKFDKKYNEEIESLRGASDAVVSNRLLSFDVKSQKEAFESIKSSLRSGKLLKGLDLYDSDGVQIKDKHKKYLEDASFELQSLDTSPLPVGDKNVGSWIVAGDVITYKGGEQIRSPKVFKIPMGANQEGFHQESLFDTYIRNNPEYRAINLMNRVISNNTKDTYSIPGVPDMKITIKNTGKVVYSSDRYDDMTDVSFKEELADKLNYRDLEFALGKRLMGSLIDIYKELNPNLNSKEDIETTYEMLADELNRAGKLTGDFKQNQQLLGDVFKAVIYAK